MTGLRDFRLETFFAEWEFKARYHLCASDMESLALGELLKLADDADREAWEKLPLSYTETRGAPDLRELIAGTYDNMEGADILCFCGAEEGIYAAMHALLDRDDHAIVLTPNYQSAETVVESLCDVTGVALDPDANWSLDLDSLVRELKPNTKLISINFPHNPSGKILERPVFDALIGLARDRGIYVFSDEVYRNLERDPAIRLPQAADVYERGISLGVMSKAYGFAGLRIGWIACSDHALLDRMERVKHYLSICNSAPSEQLAKIALKARNQILARNRAIVSDNLSHLNAFFADFPDLFDWREPDGGCIGFPKYRGADGVDEFAARLVREKGVLLLPAGIYHSTLTATPTDRFRIGYGRLNMGEGLRGLREFLDGREP